MRSPVESCGATEPENERRHRDRQDYEAYLPLDIEGMYNRLGCIGAGTEGSGSMRESFGKPRHPRTGSIK